MSEKAKERPIIFSGPMVQAILDDKKTMTRRVINPQPQAKYMDGRWYADRYNHSLDWCFWGKPDTDVANLCGLPLFRCPYAKERLWVRETWGVFPPEEDAPAADWAIRYKATPEAAIHWRDNAGWMGYDGVDGKWKPSIFMPRWASRVTLENMGVKIERVQDISEQDILAEGITVDLVAEWCNVPWSDMPTLHDAWRVAWIHINGLESWERNDLVWAVSFRRIREAIK